MENKFLFLSKKNSDIKKKTLLEICKIKDVFWKHGIKTQYDWVKKKLKKEDIHNLVYYNNNLIGYNLLRKRKFYLGNKKQNYFYFDTLIIHPKFRKQKISLFLMKLNHDIFKKFKLHSFLICQKKHELFYKKFNWTKINNKNFSIEDHKFFKKKYIGMICNFNHSIITRKKIYFLDKI